MKQKYHDWVGNLCILGLCMMCTGIALYDWRAAIIALGISCFLMASTGTKDD